MISGGGVVAALFTAFVSALKLVNSKQKEFEKNIEAKMQQTVENHCLKTQAEYREKESERFSKIYHSLEKLGKENATQQEQLKQLLARPIHNGGYQKMIDKLDAIEKKMSE